jgi:large subunit ribosomal protein L29
MKNEEIKGLNLDELKEKLMSEKEGLRKLMFAHKVSAIENPMKIKETRRLIARLNTHLGARQLQK